MYSRTNPQQFLQASSEFVYPRSSYKNTDQKGYVSNGYTSEAFEDSAQKKVSNRTTELL